MRSRSDGFTLLELLVVVVILGILAAIAVPQYTKSIENSKADDASAVVKMIGTTNRMFKLDNEVYASGLIGNSSCGGSCSGSFGGGAVGCDLIRCRYLASTNLDAKGYQFWAGNGSCGTWGGSNYIACAKRKTGSSPGTGDSRYTGWGYAMTDAGQIVALGGAPAPAQ